MRVCRDCKYGERMFTPVSRDRSISEFSRCLHPLAKQERYSIVTGVTSQEQLTCLAMRDWSEDRTRDDPADQRCGIQARLFEPIA